jgi:hypothetical protein
MEKWMGFFRAHPELLWDRKIQAVSRFLFRDNVFRGV